MVFGGSKKDVVRPDAHLCWAGHRQRNVWDNANRPCSKHHPILAAQRSGQLVDGLRLGARYCHVALVGYRTRTECLDRGLFCRAGSIHFNRIHAQSGRIHLSYHPDIFGDVQEQGHPVKVEAERHHWSVRGIHHAVCDLQPRGECATQ